MCIPPDILASLTHIEGEAEVRYWEDTHVNGVEDTDGSLIPGRDGPLWKVRLNIAEGRIENWPSGMVADIHYKVCDAGQYWLTDSSGKRLAEWKGSYVPDEFLCHDEMPGYGDYIILKVRDGGFIEGYRRPVVDSDRWKWLKGEMS